MVFVGVGETDTSPAPHREAAIYEASSDVTFYRLTASAHCHNFAGTRQRLWDRILAWIPSVGESG